MGPSAREIIGGSIQRFRRASCGQGTELVGEGDVVKRVDRVVLVKNELPGRFLRGEMRSWPRTWRSLEQNKPDHK